MYEQYQFGFGYSRITAGWRPSSQYIEQHYDIPAEQFTIADATFTQSTISQFSDTKEQQQFADQLAGDGQGDIDNLIDNLADPLEKATSFEEAQAALTKQYTAETQNPKGFFASMAHRIDNLRHVSRNTGASEFKDA